jgi:hypothetical protein
MSKERKAMLAALSACIHKAPAAEQEALKEAIEAWSNKFSTSYLVVTKGNTLVANLMETMIDASEAMPLMDPKE